MIWCVCVCVRVCVYNGVSSDQGQAGLWCRTLGGHHHLNQWPAAYSCSPPLVHKVPASTDNWTILLIPPREGRSLLWWAEWKAFGHGFLCKTAERLLHRYCTLSPLLFFSLHSSSCPSRNESVAFSTSPWQAVQCVKEPECVYMFHVWYLSFISFVVSWDAGAQIKAWF